MRTVLNEKQLHTLRTCYAANPRPDALMKEQLVEMTGLSPRVIRVWFQNKRCKDKKRSIMMKQLQQQQPNDKTVSGPVTGQGTQGKQRRHARCVVAAQFGARFPSCFGAGALMDGGFLTPTQALGRGSRPPGLPVRADLPGRPLLWVPQPAWVGSRPSTSPTLRNRKHMGFPLGRQQQGLALVLPTFRTLVPLRLERREEQLLGFLSKPRA